MLIALGLYFFAGAWGVFLLWCLALLFVAPQGFATLALVEGSGEERAKGRHGVAAVKRPSYSAKSLIAKGNFVLIV